LKKSRNPKMITLLVLSMLVMIVIFPSRFPILSSSAFGDEVTSESQRQLALVFVEKVAGINLSKYAYNISVGKIGGEFEVQIRVSSEKGNVTIFVSFMRGKILFVQYKPETPPSWLWTDKVSNNLYAARQIIERSQLFLNTSYIQCIQLLNNALPNQNQTITRENMTLQIRDNGRKLDWNCVINGIPVLSYLQVHLSDDGHLIGFGNGGQIYRVGTTQVKISKEQAISIAYQYAQKYANEHGQTIASVYAMLQSTWGYSAFRGDEYVIYLDWVVQMTFDKVNIDGVTRYVVHLSADTGQVLKHAPYGPIKVYSPEGTESPLNYLLGFSIVAIVASTTTASFIVYRKRRLDKMKGGYPCHSDLFYFL